MEFLNRISAEFHLWFMANPAAGAIVIGLLMVAAIGSAIYFLLAGSPQQNRKQAVAARWVQQLQAGADVGHKKNLTEYLNWLPVTEQDKVELGRLLVQAGFRQPGAIFVLVAAKLLALLLIPLLMWLSSDDTFNLYLLSKLTIFSLLGSMAPEWWLKRRAQQKMEQLRAAVPDAVDLMVICAESGLHIDAMLERVAADVQEWSPTLAEELRYTHADIQVGSDRSDALMALAERTQVSEIRHLVTALVQADQYGTPLVKALKDIARETRRLHLLNVEERIGRIPATISLPLMIFVLIPLVVLLAGPSIVMLIRSLKGI